MSHFVTLRFSLNKPIHHHHLPGRLAITEHLTASNLTVLKKAQELFGSAARTENCKVLVKIYGSDSVVSTIEDVQKLYNCYCEFIGSRESVTAIDFPLKRPSKKSYASAAAKNTGSGVRSNRHPASTAHNRQAAGSVRYKHFDPLRAAEIDEFNPVISYSNSRHSNGRSFYKKR